MSQKLKNKAYKKIVLVTEESESNSTSDQPDQPKIKYQNKVLFPKGALNKDDEIIFAVTKKGKFIPVRHLRIPSN
mgnify:CR=1 FL=1